MEILLGSFDEDALERLRLEFSRRSVDGLQFSEFVSIMIVALPHLYALVIPVSAMPRATSFNLEEVLRLLNLMTPDTLKLKFGEEWDAETVAEFNANCDVAKKIGRKVFDKLSNRRREVIEHKKLVNLVVLLRELFDEIDVNGDGFMEWDEFTGYCVELGFVATRRQTKPLEYKFECVCQSVFLFLFLLLLLLLFVLSFVGLLVLLRFVIDPVSEGLRIAN